MLLVLPDPAATTGAIASLALLAAFTVAVVVNLLRDNRVDCHCFGSVGDQGAIGWHTVGRNGVFLALAALSLIGNGSQPSVPGAVADMSAVVAILWALGLLALGVLVLMGVLLQQLIGRYGAALLRIEVLEQSTGIAERPLLTAFTLPDLDGQEVALEPLLAEGRPVMITFVSPTCHNCTDVLPDLSAWQADEEHPFDVLVLTDGSVEDNRAKIAGVGALQMLVQEDRDLAIQTGVRGTPAAFMIDVDGRLAGPPVHGPDAIRDLHDATVQMLTGTTPPPHLHQIEQPPVREGDAAPDTAVELETGERVPLADAFGDDAVALFWRFDCGFCARILEDVKALEATTPIRIVTGSSIEAIRESGLTSPIISDHTGELERWLQVQGTPSAARITGGRLASKVGVGGPETLEVIDSARSEILVD